MTQILKATSPIYLDGKSDIVIVSPKIVGGVHCISLHKCRNVTIQGGSLTGPTGEAPNNPDDPVSHHILFDDCDDCHAIGVTTT